MTQVQLPAPTISPHACLQLSMIWHSLLASRDIHTLLVFTHPDIHVSKDNKCYIINILELKVNRSELHKIIEERENYQFFLLSSWDTHSLKFFNFSIYFICQMASKWALLMSCKRDDFVVCFQLVIVNFWWPTTGVLNLKALDVFLKMCLLFLFYLNEWFVCMYIWVLCMRPMPVEAREVSWPPETGFNDGCQLPYECWESNHDFL